MTGKYLFPTIVLSCCLAFAAPARSGAYPDPTWPLPGFPQPDGSPYYPLWTGTSYLDSVRATGAHRLHEIGITGQGVSAAVIDDPIDMNHPALADKIIRPAAAAISVVERGSAEEPYHPGMTLYKTVVENGETYDIYLGTGTDIAGLPVANFEEKVHGTHVAGIVAGMAPGAGLVLVNTANWTGPDRDPDDLDSDGNERMGLEYIANIGSLYNIIAVNCSWGVDIYPPSTAAADIMGEAELGEYLRDLIASGVIGVFSSGNESINNSLIIPAAMTGALAVGSLSEYGLISGTSNQSDKVVLLAPGGNIYSSVPYSGYLAQSGTSMAAPHVTGALVLLASGARNASGEEIMSALIKSADPVVYDGSVVLPSSMFSAFTSSPEYVNALLNISTIGIDVTIDHTMEEWRNIYRIVSMLIDTAPNNLNDLATWEANYNALVAANTYPDNGPLNFTNYRFIRVDKAYMQLTSDRMQTQAATLGALGAPAGAMLAAFGGELFADIDKETSDIFQNLDAMDPYALAGVARQMSPQLPFQVLEQGQIKLFDIQRSVIRQGELYDAVTGTAAQIGVVAGDNGLANLTPSGFARPRMWVEGFGSLTNSPGNMSRSKYHANYAGAMFGLETAKGDFAGGLFGSWADTRVKSHDGKADGDWYSTGLYGRFKRDRLFVGGSLAYSYGRFTSGRDIFIPGAVFTSNIPGAFIVRDSIERRSGSKVRAHAGSLRLQAGYDAWEAGGWTLAPQVEMGLSATHMPGFRENGAGALDLSLSGFNTWYAEGGVGMGASKAFQAGNGSKFIASARVIGAYGGGFGEKMKGNFTKYGSAFRYSPERTKTLWCLPEAAVTWSVNDRLDVSVGYNGRFGKRHYENSGFLRVGLSW